MRSFVKFQHNSYATANVKRSFFFPLSFNYCVTLFPSLFSLMTLQNRREGVFVSQFFWQQLKSFWHSNVHRAWFCFPNGEHCNDALSARISYLWRRNIRFIPDIVIYNFSRRLTGCSKLPLNELGRMNKLKAFLLRWWWFMELWQSCCLTTPNYIQTVICSSFVNTRSA